MLQPSFVLQEPGKVSFEDRPIPELTSDTDVLINVKFTGICGSDVHYWHEGRIGDFIVRSPMVLGHESSGIVHSVGKGVKNLKPGDRVAMEPGIPCRQCGQCKSGMYNLCKDTRFAATPPYDGTLARYYILPQDFCYKLPDHVSLEEGALVEPLAVAVHVVRLAPVTPGQSVVVYGAGPVGLLCMAVAKAFGAVKVIAVDVNAERLQFAGEFAATSTFKPDVAESAADAAKRLVQETGLDGGADVAIEATGVQACGQQACHVLRDNGIYVQAGMGKPTMDGLPIVEMMSKEAQMKTSFRYKQGDYELAVKLVAGGSVDVKRCITGKVPFREAEQAFGDTRMSKGIKTLICGPE